MNPSNGTSRVSVERIQARPGGTEEFIAWLPPAGFARCLTGKSRADIHFWRRQQSGKKLTDSLVQTTSSSTAAVKL